jgi:mono/diheme cytochrome c family protein
MVPAWRELTPADLSAVAEVVREFHAPQPEPAIPQAVLDLGARVYAGRCAQCHGVNGTGDGPAGGQFALAPTNFRTQRPNLAASLNALRNGIEGSPMAPWSSELSEVNGKTVYEYLPPYNNTAYLTACLLQIPPFVKKIGTAPSITVPKQ